MYYKGSAWVPASMLRIGKYTSGSSQCQELQEGDAKSVLKG